MPANGEERGLSAAEQRALKRLEQKLDGKKGVVKVPREKDETARVMEAAAKKLLKQAIKMTVKAAGKVTWVVDLVWPTKMGDGELHPDTGKGDSEGGSAGGSGGGKDSGGGEDSGGGGGGGGKLQTPDDSIK